MWTGNNRAPWHDYRSKAIYHITLLKKEDVPDFGRIAGNCDIKPGLPGSSFLRASEVGRAIKAALRKIPEIDSALRLYQYALMPDHLHLLLSVEREMDDILGHKIAALKVHAGKLSGLDKIFEKGFNDQIITPNRELSDIYRYLRENPHRLAVRLVHPEYFRRVHEVIVGGRPYSAYGNLQLLYSPFKEQVIVHRADSDETRSFNRNRWLHCAANGGVLVSPFISGDEKEIREEAETLESKIILINNKPYLDREKPGTHNFEQCEQGRLLILTPRDVSFATSGVSRPDCLAMNACAAQIAAWRPTLPR